MLLFRKPSPDSIRAFLDYQKPLGFSYAAVGATAETPPPRYVVDRTRIQLGMGEQAFRAARAALERWQQFKLGWVEAWPPDTPIQTGTVVGIMARTAGLWWLNACRIVYVVDESSPIRRFGFAYGTLPGHAESGEERFLVECDPSNDGVWYDILAFSYPNHVLARIGYPVARRFQKRFARDSAAAMQRGVAARLTPAETGPGCR
jgi:uncharacterized protein (UPF0548 family)